MNRDYIFLCESMYVNHVCESGLDPYTLNKVDTSRIVHYIEKYLLCVSDKYLVQFLYYIRLLSLSSDKMTVGTRQVLL